MIYELLTRPYIGLLLLEKPDMYKFILTGKVKQEVIILVTKELTTGLFK